MKISISGGSGFLGKSLVRELVRRDHQVVHMTRDSFRMPVGEFVQKKIDGMDAVVNLAGATIIKHWTQPWKEEIRNSRILTTRMIAEAVSQATVKPKVLVSSSGISIYDSVNTHTEDSVSFDNGFLAQVCREWEAEAMKVNDATRLVILRQGVILGNGGMLEKVRLPFSIGLGGTIGNGRQPFSFIHIDDLVAIILAAIGNENMSGIYNAVAPWPTDNRHFTDVLGKVFMQPAFLRVPLFALKLVYGEGATIMSDGQRVLPERLMKEDFPFKYPTVEKALMQILR